MEVMEKANALVHKECSDGENCFPNHVAFKRKMQEVQAGKPTGLFKHGANYSQMQIRYSVLKNLCFQPDLSENPIQVRRKKLRRVK